MGSEAKVIGLIADSGVPLKIAQSIAGELKQELADRIEGARWNVAVSEEPFSLTPEGDIPFMDSAQEMRRRYEWDYIVYLTELPRHHNKEPMLCEVSTAKQALLISVPALGGPSPSRTNAEAGRGPRILGTERNRASVVGGNCPIDRAA